MQSDAGTLIIEEESNRFECKIVAQDGGVRTYPQDAKAFTDAEIKYITMVDKAVSAAMMEFQLSRFDASNIANVSGLHEFPCFCYIFRAFGLIGLTGAVEKTMEYKKTLTQMLTPGVKR